MDLGGTVKKELTQPSVHCLIRCIARLLNNRIINYLVMANILREAWVWRYFSISDRALYGHTKHRTTEVEEEEPMIMCWDRCGERRACVHSWDYKLEQPPEFSVEFAQEENFVTQPVPQRCLITCSRYSSLHQSKERESVLLPISRWRNDKNVAHTMEMDTTCK